MSLITSAQNSVNEFLKQILKTVTSDEKIQLYIPSCHAVVVENCSILWAYWKQNSAI